MKARKEKAALPSESVEAVHVDVHLQPWVFLFFLLWRFLNCHTTTISLNVDSMKENASTFMQPKFKLPAHD